MGKAPHSISVLTVLATLSAGGAAAAAGPARLLRDINQAPSYEMGSYPEQFHRNGSLSYFRASTPGTGIELCRTDGTEAGTFLVKDIWPGAHSGMEFSLVSGNKLPFQPADLGDKIFFIANDGVHGWELWTSDGTEAGTQMLKETRPGSPGGFDGVGFTPIWRFFETPGLLYFLADGGGTGFELWRTDGTEAGTFLVKEIYPGIYSPFGYQIVAAEMGGILYFVANDLIHGTELWRTDGTSANTWMVKNLEVGSLSSDPSNLVNLNGTLIFWAFTSTGLIEPYRSDGTEAGTVPVLEDRFPGFVRPHSLAVQGDSIIYTSNQRLFRLDVPGQTFAELRTFTSGSAMILGTLGGRVFLQANDGVHGSELWGTDGTVAGTSLVKDINPGSASSVPSDLVLSGGQAFFLAQDGVHGRALWASDGTEAATRMAVETTPGPEESIIRIFGLGGLCYVVAHEPGVGYRLWVTDGDQSGSRRIGKLALSSWEAGFAPDGSLLVSGEDEVSGTELWKSDGTESGTVMLKDINPLVRNMGSVTAFLGGVDVPGSGPRIFFMADDDIHGHELWVSDGTPPGTRLVKDIAPGRPFGFVTAAVPYAGALFFICYDRVHGFELWRSDGSEAGTYMVADIAPGFTDGVVNPYDLVEFKGLLYFVGGHPAYGHELWKSDGTEAGTSVAIETLQGPDSFMPEMVFATHDLLYFSAYDPNSDYTLWRSDGTQAGTFMLTHPAAGGPYGGDEFTAFAGGVFFRGYDPRYGGEPWVSDGTEAGTYMLGDLWPNSRSSVGGMLAQVMGESILFRADDGVHGGELWKTDGTSAGTELVKDVFPGPIGNGFTCLAPLNGLLYFDAFSSVPVSNEIWRTDGTEQGTFQIANNLGPNLFPMVGTMGGLVFTNQDASLGKELWTSDGTAKGTRLAQDIAPGPGDSLPKEYTELGTRLFFLADDRATGYEPWAVHTAILFRQPARAIQDMKTDVKTLKLGSVQETSLLQKLDAAAQAFSGGRIPQALDALLRFKIAVREQTPRWISEAMAADLIQFAEEGMELLRHPDADAGALPKPGPAPRYYANQ